MCLHNRWVWDVHYTNKSQFNSPAVPSLLLFDGPNCHQLRWLSITNHAHIWCAGMVDPRHNLEKSGGGPINTCTALLLS